jgi:hypothetical protein
MDFGLPLKGLGVLGDLLHKHRQKQLWDKYIAVIKHLQEVGANTWTPAMGSADHKLAEAFVEKGWMKRCPGLFGYMRQA